MAIIPKSPEQILAEFRYDTATQFQTIDSQVVLGYLQSVIAWAAEQAKPQPCKAHGTESPGQECAWCNAHTMNGEYTENLLYLAEGLVKE